MDSTSRSANKAVTGEAVSSDYTEAIGFDKNSQEAGQALERTPRGHPAEAEEEVPSEAEEGECTKDELIERQRARIAELEDLQQQLEDLQQQLLGELQNAEDRIAELEATVEEQDEIIQESFRAAEESRKNVQDETSALKEVIQMQQATMEKQEQLIQDSSEVLENLSSCGPGSPTGQNNAAGTGSMRAPVAPSSAPGAGYGAGAPQAPPGRQRRAASEHRRRPAPQPPALGREDIGPLGRQGLNSHRGPRPPPEPPGIRANLTELRAAYTGAGPVPAKPLRAGGSTPRGSYARPPPHPGAEAGVHNEQQTRLPRVLGN